jgi:aminoglycoside phosphotransferase family enzyme/predicted kinase
MAIPASGNELIATLAHFDGKNAEFSAAELSARVPAENGSKREFRPEICRSDPARPLPASQWRRCSVHDEAGQEDVVRLLADPATHDGAPVERIDTHASVVFLAGTRAFKLKRAVKYDYLDFSTIDRRKRFCEAEMRINSRMAPALYRRVIPVTQTPGGVLTLGGQGRPVDWVVEMTRFEQDALFDRMAAAGRLEPALMESLSEEVASFHASCAVREEFGGAPGITRVIDGNDSGLRQFGRDCLGAAACDAVTAASRTTLRRAAALLERRRRSGYVRECHGDLHLGNIVLWEGRPTLFDAIEFNDDIACIDVMYDVAFLWMDLWHRGLHGHANSVFNGYLGETRDFDGLAPLPLFLSCRAAVRAKTTITAAPLQATADAQHRMRVRAMEYLDLAIRLLRPPRPVIVAIGGLSGSGKSTVARALAPSVGAVPGALVLRSDETRKRLWGASALTRLGRSAYTPEMSARVYEALVSDATAAAAGGQSAIVDAVFARTEDRVALERAARIAGVPFAALWLEAPEPVLIERVTNRGADASDADADVVRMQYARSAGEVRWPHVDAAARRDVVIACAHASLQGQAVALDVAA